MSGGDSVRPRLAGVGDSSPEDTETIEGDLEGVKNLEKPEGV